MYLFSKSAIYTGLVGLVASACLAASDAAAARTTSDPVRIMVDASRGSKADNLFLYRTGVFLNSLPVGYPKQMFFADHRPGMLEFSWDFYGELLHSENEQQFFARLPDSNLTAWIRATAAEGGEPYIRLMPVPKWLWSQSDGFRKPPSDWDGWSRFVGRIADYYSNELGLDVKYLVWDEPDGFWKGSQDEYFRLYKYAVAGVKKAVPRAKIGGPNTASFSVGIGEHTASGPGVIEFIKYCANNSLPGLGKRLPIDILAWHAFDAAPISPGRYDHEVERARQLLRDFGYGDDVEINIGSWSALERYPDVTTNIRDGEFLSSFIVATVNAMDAAGVDRHAFFNLYEDWRSHDREFSDDTGLTTKSYVVKAGYNAFRLLNRITGEKLQTSIDDSLMTAVSARDGPTYRVLLANFIPPKSMLREVLGRRVLMAGYRASELKKLLPEGASLEDFLRDDALIRRSRLPDDVKAIVFEAKQMAATARSRYAGPVSVALEIRGLLPGTYRMRWYTIDDGSSNAFSERSKLERKVEKIDEQARKSVAQALKRGDPNTGDDALRRINRLEADFSAKIANLPPDQRHRAREALARLRAHKFEGIKTINESSDVGLVPSGVESVRISGTYQRRVSVDSYAVLLLELERTAD